MQYDPVKDRFGRLVSGHPRRMRLFFGLLQLFFLRAWYVRRRLRQVLDGRSGPIRMLDAGTGFGQFAWWAARRWPLLKIRAVDVKSDYLTHVRDLFESAGMSDRAEFVVDDLVHLRSEGPFDLILSVDVMEHIEEDGQVFDHFFRVLAPGGVVIVNTPSDRGGSDAGDGDSFISEHVRDGYGRDELREKLETAGLKVDSIDYTYGRFGSMAWRLSIKWPMMILGSWWGFVLLLPLYYVPVLPLAMLLNVLDGSSANPSGTGLIAVAHRP